MDDAGGEAISIYHGSLHTASSINLAEAVDNGIELSDINITAPIAASLQYETNGGSTTNVTPFGTVVAQSRVYRRVEHREIDVGSIDRSTRSRGWSILSGLSASKVTCVGVIALPLGDVDLVRFRKYLPVPAVLDPFQSTRYPLPNPIRDAFTSKDLHLKDPTWCSKYGIDTYKRHPLPLNGWNHEYYKRLMNEWTGHAVYHSEGICVTLIGNDLVCNAPDCSSVFTNPSDSHIGELPSRVQQVDCSAQIEERFADF